MELVQLHHWSWASGLKKVHPEIDELALPLTLGNTVMIPPHGPLKPSLRFYPYHFGAHSLMLVNFALFFSLQLDSLFQPRGDRQQPDPRSSADRCHFTCLLVFISLPWILLLSAAHAVRSLLLDCQGCPFHPLVRVHPPEVRRWPRTRRPAPLLCCSRLLHDGAGWILLEKKQQQQPRGEDGPPG